uniref:Purple acid phosphatase N-terminal domain-containing protein n=1 Tax=Brassica oleracea var. oleracea TaxID=109376 RepID=A0A0D3BDY7_BRAOL
MGHFQALNPYYVLLFLCLVLDSLVLFSHGGTTSSYVRRLQATVDMPLDSDVFRVSPGCDAPQQETLKEVIVSWMAQKARGFNTVLYWKDHSCKMLKAHGKSKTYKFYNYTSGHIHHCTLRNLEYDTKYYYMGRVGQTERKFWFFTPPKPGADVPYTFGFIGFQDTITNKTERVGNVRTRFRRSEEP